MRKRSLLVMALAGVMIASCACGTTDSAETTTATVTEQKAEVKTEETKKEETTTAQATTEAAKDSAKEKDSASATEAKSVDKKDENSDSKTSDDNNVVEVDDAGEESTLGTEKDNTNSDYAANTTASKAEVQSFVEGVKSDIENSSWESLADKLNYPVSINPDKTANDKDEFISIMNDSKVSQAFLDELNGADLGNLSSNGQGLMVGSGCIWLRDVNFDGIEQVASPEFKVITFNGLTE
jgi:hypothetical protein